MPWCTVLQSDHSREGCSSWDVCVLASRYPTQCAVAWHVHVCEPTMACHDKRVLTCMKCKVEVNSSWS